MFLTVSYLASIICITSSLKVPAHRQFFRTKINVSPTSSETKFEPKNPVIVFNDPKSLQDGLCDDFLTVAKKEISEKDAFYCAVPGGSVLKMLGGLKNRKDELDWSKVFLYYVNHKCVGPTDPTATHYKAKTIFLDDVGIPKSNVFSLENEDTDETPGFNTDAHLYEQKISEHVPVYFDVPRFDYMLLGMGKDGHIGSLYPDRKEVEMTDRFVLPVDKKTPASITLSLPVMNSAKNIRVVLHGADKSDAVFAGLFRTKSFLQYPVCGVNNATWIIDKGAATEILRQDYQYCVLK